LTILSPGPGPMELMRSIAYFCLAQAKLGAEGAGGESNLMRLPRPTTRTGHSEASLVELGESALRLAVVDCRDKSIRTDEFDYRAKDLFERIRATRDTIDQQVDEQFTLERMQQQKPQS